MRVLLLGSSGLLGHNVLRRLVNEGYSVRVLLRNRHSLKTDVTGVEVLECSILDEAAVRDAAQSCDAVVNCVGTTDMSLLHLSDYLPMNRDLCGWIVNAMESHEINTLVHTSTVNTIGYGQAGQPADESVPMMPPFSESYYAESKCCGEEIVLEAARKHPNWHVVVVNPGYMLGAMDVKPSSGRMLLMGLHRRLMFAPRGGKAFVHVQDVAEAEVNALRQGESGSRYIVVNSRGCHTIKQLYEMQAHLLGYRQHVVVLPDFLLAMAGRVGDVLRALGVRTEISTRNVRQLMVREYYSNSHALSDLHYSERSVEQAILDFHSWYRNKNQQ